MVETTKTGHWTKKRAELYFAKYIKDYLPLEDLPAHREAWNNFTDALHKNKWISNRQYNQWQHPAYIRNWWINRR